jgi:DNA polymerase-3 subunit delta
MRAMAIQGAKELRTELTAIKKGKISPVYLVFGAEGYLVRTAADALIKALSEPPGTEVLRLDAQGKSPAAVLEPVATLSLFATARVVVVRSFAHLLTGDEADALLAGLDRGVGEGCALVFVAPGDTGEKVDKRVKGYKGLAKRGVVVELNRQDADDLAHWLREQAELDGVKLSPDAAQLLLQRVGEDMQTLRNELDKAVLYCLDKKRIDAADLERLVGKSREDAVWSVSEAVAARDAVTALQLLEDLLATGTYPLVILTLLIRQARHLLQARLLWERAGSPRFHGIGGFRSQVASTFQTGAFGGGPDDVTTIHPFASFKRFEMAQGHDVAELREVLVRVRRADRDAKTGATAGPREVLEELVLDLCAARGTGRAAGRAA